ncbi:MAG: hypothetical protein FJ144_03260 [Deltaproteobacteria bacterium]|nr:hypothetical protein [Deltaproteobacteria bacterium]
MRAVALGCAIGCGGSGDSTDVAAPVSPPSPTPGSCAEFASTFEAIQTVVFERHGCTQEVCHGSAASGGLDLRPDVAWSNLVEIPSVGSSLARVVPGDRERSYLYLKLAAKTLPGTVAINGAPMPSGLPALRESELEAVRLWITAGAPQTGTVPGTESLLDACLPPPEPITIDPLEPPAPDEGVQFVLPPLSLAAGREREVCFATYYDLHGKVPERFLDPTGEFFRISAQELRQDPVSHHLVLSHSGVPIEEIDHPAFGAWTCASGERGGEPCDPLDLDACGSGICRSEVRDSFACVGFGPPSVIGIPSQTRSIGGAQEAQAFQRLLPGVFGQVPLSGIAFWNSHAFNLTAKDHELNGRINLYFAQEQRFPVVAVVSIDSVLRPNNPPFTEETFCGTHVLPQGARLFSLTSHNHKRGKRFWVEAPDGALLYENFTYADPTRQPFDPPLAFDSSDAGDRTLRYCGTFNNGVNEDGSPNVETVTRASRIPDSATAGFFPTDCEPVACVAGRIAEPCEADVDCDSSPGASDGWCDACPITAGESTENEMFILLGQLYVAEGFPQPPDEGFIGVGF